MTEPHRRTCAADCGQPLTRWHVDADGRHWHPGCLPPGTAMAPSLQEQVRQLTAALDLATEFRIPCPHPHFAGGHQDPRFRSEPITVRRRQDGRGDGWLILNPNLLEGDHVWTGSEWVYRGELHRDVIYKWTRDEALALAPELAAAETARYETWVNDMRRPR